jgi:hypothetical protein
MFMSLQIKAAMAHDLSGYAWNVGVVFANGSASSLNMDLHRLFPYGSLWSNLNVGKGGRVLACTAAVL